MVAESPPVAIAPDVHPMSAPAFAVSGVVKQLVDERLVPVRVVIVEVVSELFGSGEVAEEIGVESSDLGFARGEVEGWEERLFERGEEAIDRMGRGVWRGRGVLGGELGIGDRLEGPMFVGGLFRLFFGREGNAGLDPLEEELALGRGEGFTFVKRGHATVGMFGGDSLPKEAGGWVVRGERGPRVTAEEHMADGIETKVGFLF